MLSLAASVMLVVSNMGDSTEPDLHEFFEANGIAVSDINILHCTR